MSGKRVGVLGLGRVGVMHARNLAGSGRVEELVLIGRDHGRLREAAAGAKSGWAGAAGTVTTTTAGFDSALAGLDGVVIATSTATHPEFALAAARAGVPTLVEKPLALDLGVLEQTAAALERTGSPVMIAFHRRYDPAHRELRRRIAAGELGTLRVVTATNHDHHRLPPAYVPISGGIWRDLLIHDFDIIPWVTGDRVTRVTATGNVLDAPVHGEYGDVDTAVAVLELASGAIATVSGTRRNGAGQDVRLELFGSDATLAAGVDAATPVTSTEAGCSAPRAPYQDFTDRFASAFRGETAAFLDLIDEADVNVSPPAAGADALRIALAAAESARNGGVPIPVQDKPGQDKPGQDNQPQHNPGDEEKPR